MNCRIYLNFSGNILKYMYIAIYIAKTKIDFWNSQVDITYKQKKSLSSP